MEIVFEPDLKDGEEASALVKELCLILERIGTCSCRMEGLSQKRVYNFLKLFSQF